MTEQNEKCAHVLRTGYRIGEPCGVSRDNDDHAEVKVEWPVVSPVLPNCRVCVERRSEGHTAEHDLIAMRNMIGRAIYREEAEEALARLTLILANTRTDTRTSSPSVDLKEVASAVEHELNIRLRPDERVQGRMQSLILSILTRFFGEKEGVSR